MIAPRRGFDYLRAPFSEDQIGDAAAFARPIGVEQLGRDVDVVAHVAARRASSCSSPGRRPSSSSSRWDAVDHGGLRECLVLPERFAGS
jgi:hypothetical protein